MKVGAKDHIKIKRLKRALNIPLYQAIGILETLLQVVAQSADDGAIGRYSNEDIAIELEWEGDADTLVAALVDSGWLDRCSSSRLVVHGWLEHAPNFIKDRLKKRNQRTCGDETGDKQGTIEPESEAVETDIGESQLTNTNQTKPIKYQPRRRRGDGTLASLGGQDLENPAKLLAWLESRIGHEPSESQQIFCLAASLAALAHAGRNPPGVFISIIDKSDPKSITADQTAEASRMLREWKCRAGPADPANGQDLEASQRS